MSWWSRRTRPGTRFVVGAFLMGATVLGATHAEVSAAPPVGGLPTSVVEIRPPVANTTFSGIDYGHSSSPQDDRSIATTWRVVQNTGNCCESYLTTTPDGRLFNFGGNYVDYSADRGETWHEVRALTPLVGGEGAIVAAPGGDVLGAAWDLNAADQLQFYKYEADTKEWYYAQMPVHEPFYDREWIGVVPGPVTVGGKTYEYVSFVKGGGWSKDVWFYSTDGLNYLAVSSHTFEQMVGKPAAASALPAVADPVLDWAQTNTNSGMTALGRGGMLAAPDFLAGALDVGSYGLLDDKTFTWSSYLLPDGKRPAGGYQVDSAGRIHNVVPTADGKGFVYGVSSDGAKTWTSIPVALPPPYSMDPTGEYGARHQWDLRANLAAGVAAVAIRAHSGNGTDQDLVYKFDITRDAPRLTRMLRIGLGDTPAGNGTASSATARMDFGSVAIFSDGRVALSFLDSKTKYCVCNLREYDAAHVHPNNWEAVGPAIAIEGTTELTGK